MAQGAVVMLLKVLFGIGHSIMKYVVYDPFINHESIAGSYLHKLVWERTVLSSPSDLLV